ncbi:hypothetical protein L207DRAFT_523528 [Hyaloscypha variabilis F]|uniref:Uncharacterized protein n=1 Tax=Hyaloscypha variabilis (strain UAMH 11265 / GT02V1 / F) TaxID=1149755 RepID=A0A2J6S5Q0_HYAVF|nr:hypothetical protein L207DRAFT_523528 [Hyaloscypha variabilis F]
MPGVKMCPVCRGSKQKCMPVDRIWIAGGRQDKCERCTLFNHLCGPHEYPPIRSRVARGCSGRASQSSSNSSSIDVTAASLPQQIDALDGLLEIKQELQRRLRTLEMQIEATMKLQVALDFPIPSIQRNENIHAEVFSSRNANARILTLMPAQAEALADRLADWGEIEIAEAAYTRILDAYRAFRKLDIKAFHETKSLLKKLADMLRNSGDLIRAENLVWEALSLRDIPGKALPSDLDLLKSLASSLPSTCEYISKSIQTTFDGVIPPHLSSPFPPLQCMMQSPFASAVSDSPFYRGEFPANSRTQDAPPILGGMDTVMDFLRVLPLETLDARDIYGQSPLFLASSLRMEGLGRGILRRFEEVPDQCIQHRLNNRDFFGQTVLGASILGGCSLQYVSFLIDAGAQVDPDTLRDLPFTPLQAAAMSGSLDIVCLLLDKGAEINRVFPGNPTPLTLAEQAEHAEVVQTLISSGGHSSPAIGLSWSPG